MKNFIRYLSRFVLLCLMVWGIWWLDSFMEIDTCLDGGEVWDYNEKRCREDCLKWNEAYGCIKLTPKQVKIFKQCGNLASCLSAKVYEEICRNNHKKWDDRRKECDFEMSIE